MERRNVAVASRPFFYIKYAGLVVRNHVKFLPDHVDMAISVKMVDMGIVLDVTDMVSPQTMPPK